jgi:ketosteroid isomerase-like protein
VDEEDVATVLRFNTCINARDLAVLSALMTDDHEFIDSVNATVKGKAAVTEAWRTFFETFPDYRNEFIRTEATGGNVSIEGRSICSFGPLNGPALWSAIVHEGKVAQWRVYEDRLENRRSLKLD